MRKIIFILMFFVLSAGGLFASRPTDVPVSFPDAIVKTGTAIPELPLLWQSDLDQAMKLALAEYQPVFVLFSSPDCSWCQRLKSMVFTDPGIKSLLQNFVLVEVDVSKDQEMAYVYQVRGVPTIIIMSSDARIRERSSGFAGAPELKNMIQQVLNPAFVQKTDAEYTELLNLLDSGEVPDDKWPEIMMALGEGSKRKEIQEKISGMKLFPRKQMVELLGDKRIAARLGALEIIEERLSDTFGFDAWLDEGSDAQNADALERMKEWAEGKDEANMRYSALTEDRLEAYIHDLISDDRERSVRAMRMLEQGGRDMAMHLSGFLAENRDLPEGAGNRVREVQYSIMVPSLSGMEPSVFAHRLVFGTLDARLKCIMALSGMGRRGVPILADYLRDQDPIVRETTVDVLTSIGGKTVVMMLKEHLVKEKDNEVVFAIIKGLGKVRSQTGLSVLTSYLTSPSEDLAITAINSIAQLKTKLATDELDKCLEDPRWRVRVAALDAVGKLELTKLKDRVIALLDDSDDFVRYSAVKCVTQVVKNKDEVSQKLEEIFLKEDMLKSSVVEAFGSLDRSLPKSFKQALEGKSPEVLLGVISGLDGCGDSGLELVESFVNNSNLDVACAAVRLLGENGMKVSKYRAVMTEVLKSDKREKVLVALESINVDRKEQTMEINIKDLGIALDSGGVGTEDPAASAPGLDDLLGAFDGAGTEPGQIETQALQGVESNAVPVPATVDIDALLSAFAGGESNGTDGRAAGTQGGDLTSLMNEIRVELESSDDGEIKFAAAILLARLGDAVALPYLFAGLADRTVSQRAAIADAFSSVPGDATLPFLQLLLADASASVRTSAIGSMIKKAETKTAFIEELFRELLKEKTRLKAGELLSDYRFGRIIGEKHLVKKAAREYAVKMFAMKHNPALQNMGLILLTKTWKTGDDKMVLPFLDAVDPFQRRAAYYALGVNAKPVFTARLKALVSDPSEYVRMVLPAIYNTGGVTWIHYLDHTQFDDESIYRSNYRQKFAVLDPEIKDALISMTRDESPKVRIEAFVSLLSNRVSVNLDKFVEAIDAFPDRDAVAERVVRYLVEHYNELGDAFKVLLPYLENSRYEDATLVEVRKHFGRDEEGGDEDLHFVYRKTEKESLPAAFLDAPAPAMVKTQALKVVYFTSAGCSDCARVNAMLKELQENFPTIEIETHDIKKVAAMRLNEVLSDRFNVPQKVRLVTPAVFSGGGFLVKKEITFSRLSDLMFRSSVIPLSNWYKVEEVELMQADAAIGRRYSAMGMGVVTIAGLLDGINPCAFATIIFLLSYLQIARRKPVEILQVGGAFVTAVFLAYFVLGLGLVEVISRIQVLRYAGRMITWAMGILALVIMAFSIRDGVLCLKGRLKEITLQLPDFLKQRIHGVIRHGAGHSRFVVAAFVAGIVISFLELACTGQVYAPTVLFMLKTGENTAGAVMYLVVYNLAFVLPLLIIFGFAYSGMRSETLIKLMKKHAAMVKFGTALLFFILFVFLIFGDRLLAVLRF